MGDGRARAAAWRGDCRQAGTVRYGTSYCCDRCTAPTFHMCQRKSILRSQACSHSDFGPALHMSFFPVLWIRIRIHLAGQESDLGAWKFTEIFK